MIPTLELPIGNSFYVKGDHIPKVSISFDTGVDLTTSTVKLQMYYTSHKVLDISSGSGITVLDALNMEIDAIPNNNLPVGLLEGDLQITDASGNNKTYFRLQMEIKAEYTI